MMFFYIINFMKVRLLIILLIFPFSLYSQNRPDKSKSIVACIGFYNLENFFDTIKDATRNDEDYTPKGKYKWDTEKYNNKVRLGLND